MSNLPRISGKACVKALEKAGFYFKRQHGSHIILRRDDLFTKAVVHHKELNRDITMLAFSGTRRL